jgi:hypothetical protein
VKAAGIVSPYVGSMVVEKYKADTYAKVVLKKVFKFFSCAVITFMALGNSDWHTPLYAVPISFALIGLLAYLSVDQFGAGSTTGCGYLIAYSVMGLFTLVGLLGLANGLVIAPLGSRVAARASIATMGPVEDAAATCLEDGCSLDTIEDLLKELKAEAAQNVAGNAELSARQKQVLLTIDQLSALEPHANLSEIEKIVAGAARSFQVVKSFSFPGEPMGYTGKEGTTVVAGKAFDK